MADFYFGRQRAASTASSVARRSSCFLSSLVGEADAEARSSAASRTQSTAIATASRPERGQE